MGMGIDEARHQQPATAVHPLAFRLLRLFRAYIGDQRPLDHHVLMRMERAVGTDHQNIVKPHPRCPLKSPQ